MTGEEIEKVRIMDYYRPRIAEKFNLREEDVLAKTCPNCESKMIKNKNVWICKECMENNA